MKSKEAPEKVPLLFFSTLGAECPETLVEAFDTTASVHNLLSASVEWVALGAYVQADILAQSRFNLDHVTAAAGSSDFFVLRMDILFHWAQPLAYLHAATSARESIHSSPASLWHRMLLIRSNKLLTEDREY